MNAQKIVDGKYLIQKTNHEKNLLKKSINKYDEKIKKIRKAIYYDPNTFEDD